MKTVYITDLDGTLLMPDATLSAFTRDALSRLYRAGVCVALSTARTAATVAKIFDGVPLGAPAALMNGACVYDLSARRYLSAEVIPTDAQAALFAAVSGMCAFAFTVENGMRIAQLIPTKVLFPDVEVSEILSETERGEGGFGSTGKY